MWVGVGRLKEGRRGRFTTWESRAGVAFQPTEPASKADEQKEEEEDHDVHQPTHFFLLLAEELLKQKYFRVFLAEKMTKLETQKLWRVNISCVCSLSTCDVIGGRG